MIFLPKWLKFHPLPPLSLVCFLFSIFAAHTAKHLTVSFPDPLDINRDIGWMCYNIMVFSETVTNKFRCKCDCMFFQISLIIIIIFELTYLRGAMGEIFLILVKNHFFILLNQFNLHTIIYNPLKFQTSITVVKSLIRPYVNFCAI